MREYLVCPHCDERLFEVQSELLPGQEDHYRNVLVPMKSGLTEQDRRACTVCGTNLERRTV